MKNNYCTTFLGVFIALVLLVSCASAPKKENNPDMSATSGQKQGQSSNQAIVDTNIGTKDKADLYLQRQQNANQAIAQAEQALAKQDETQASTFLQQALRIDPNNLHASQLLEQIQRRSVLKQELKSAQSLPESQIAEALMRVNQVIEQDPNWKEALTVRDKLLKKYSARDNLSPALGAHLRKPISLNVHSQNLISVFDMISQLAGVNFIFDPDVSTSATATIYAKQTTVEDAIRLLLSTHQLSQKVLNNNTLLIYPTNPTKDKEYKEMEVKTFFLSHADPRDTMSALRQMIKVQDLYVDKRLNALVIRDTPEVVALADRLVQALDRPQSEVTLEIEVLEMNVSDVQKLGLEPPGEINAGLGEKGGNISSLRKLVLTDSVALKLKALEQESKVSTLANPKIRVKNHEKASVDIKEQIPIIKTVVSATNSDFAGEDVSMQEVGLMLNVEPSISLNDEVTVKLDLEFSSLGDKVMSGKHTYYRIIKRTAKTILTTQNNQTMVLAGLIRRDESKASSGIPFFSKIPLIKYLFGGHDTDNRNSELVLLITPRIERNLALPSSGVSAFGSGTEARPGTQNLQLRSTESELKTK